MNLLLNHYFYNKIDIVQTVLKTNNHITLSWVKHILESSNIRFYILDESMSSVEGNISAIPMRILVDNENLEKAKKIINEAKKNLKIND